MGWWNYILAYMIFAGAFGVCYGQAADSPWAKRCCYHPFEQLKIKRSDTLRFPQEPCIEIRTVFHGAGSFVFTIACDSTIADDDLPIPRVFDSQEESCIDASYKTISSILRKYGRVTECYTYTYDSLGRLATKTGFINGQAIRIEYLDYDDQGTAKKVVTTTASEETTETILQDKDEHGKFRRKISVKTINANVVNCN